MVLLSAPVLIIDSTIKTNTTLWKSIIRKQSMISQNLQGTGFAKAVKAKWSQPELKEALVQGKGWIGQDQANEGCL